MKTIDSAQFRLPFDHPAPRDIMMEHFSSVIKHEFPIAGGWGYSFEDAVIIDPNDPAALEYPGFNPIKLEYDFVPVRLYEELCVMRAPDEAYAKLKWDLKRQTLKFENKRMYDELIFGVTMIRVQDIDILQNDWESHGGYKDDRDGLEKHMKMIDSFQLKMEETFYFDITLTTGNLFSSILEKNGKGDLAGFGKTGEEPEE